jgi:hypothetical protein
LAYGAITAERLRGSELSQADSFNGIFGLRDPAARLGENFGVPFQVDIGSPGTSMQEWVAEVTLTAW